MPRTPRARTPRRQSLPDDLKLGTTLLAGLHGRGLLSRVGEWLPLARRAGHGASALFAFALVFLGAGRQWGIRPFALTFGTALHGLVAPLLGYRSLPTAASVSRALGRLEHPAVRTFLDRLLTADPETTLLLNSPHVRHRDAHGRGWHVLDFDPTIEAFRQRGLPEDPLLPEAARISPGTPGYTGHKRGELRIRHLPLQHAGSSVWLAYRLDATGESVLPLLAELLQAGRSVLELASPGEIVVRADGEFCSVGAMRTCLAARVHVLTRLCRYALLDRHEVIEAMGTATWQPVPTDGSGPRREAADLGLFTLYPDDRAQDAGGGPVEVRVVVSRFPRCSDPDHGILLDGFQVELFATSLPSDAWPAGHLVALYFGRSAMESRFAQEDREIGIDRTFSYHPPGQEWMSGIGLFLWNLLVGRGVAAAPLPPQALAQVARAPMPAAEPPASAAEPAPITPEPTLTVNEQEFAPEPVADPTDAQQTPPFAEDVLREELWKIARDAFDRQKMPAGWSLDDARREVRCPNGRGLFVYAAESEVRHNSRGERNKHRIMVRTETQACNGCPLRAECTSSERPNMCKQVTRSISGTEVLRARELLGQLKSFSRKAQLRRIWERRESERLAGAPAPEPPRPLRAPPSGAPPGPWVPDVPLFVPSASRHLVRALIFPVQVDVKLAPRRDRPPPAHPLLAPTQAARRHQRLSWTRRAERRAYAGKATLYLGTSRLTASNSKKIARSFAL
jgi:hypothetical protein